MARRKYQPPLCKRCGTYPSLVQVVSTGEPSGLCHRCLESDKQNSEALEREAEYSQQKPPSKARAALPVCTSCLSVTNPISDVDEFNCGLCSRCKAKRQVVRPMVWDPARSYGQPSRRRAADPNSIY